MTMLTRFLTAQEYNYSIALDEIKNGKKCTCWMWYVFPQIIGLGRSNTAVFYSIRDLDEAKAYLNHETLGPRLLEISEALLQLKSGDAYEVFGYPDNLKLQSSMTLFACAAPENIIFKAVLDKFFGGKECEKTLEILARAN